MKLATSLLALAISPAAALAQQPTLQLDFASSTASFGPPAVTYPGASGARGIWNDIDGGAAGGSGTLSTGPLNDAAGNPTGVVCHLDAAAGGLILTYAEDAPSTTGNDQALLDDCIYFQGDGTIRLELLPAGTYDVYTYAVAPDAAAFPGTRSTRVDVPGSMDGPQVVEGGFAGAYVSGMTHALHRVTVDGTTPLDILISAAAGIDSVNGLQIVPVGGNAITQTTFCSPNPNSTGVPGVLTGSGSTAAAANDLTLLASDLPPGQFGIFVVSREAIAFIPLNQGVLCLSGSIGRYVGPGQVFQASATGEASLQVDLPSVPLPSVLGPVLPGDTLFFQAWHRDVGPQPTTNFTGGFSVTLN